MASAIEQTTLHCMIGRSSVIYDDVDPSIVLDTTALPHQTDGPCLVMGNLPRLNHTSA